MNNIKVEHKDDDLTPVSIPLNIKQTNSSQPAHCITESVEHYSANLHDDVKSEKIINENNNSVIVNDIFFKNPATAIPSNTVTTFSEGVIELNEKTTKSSVDLPKSSKIYISCRFCKKGFKTLKKISNHDCRKKKVNSKNKIHKCKFCSLTFSKKIHLTTHVKGHKRNNCTHCNAQFTKRKALCKHLRNVHKLKEPEKLYECSFCDKHFSKRQSLHFHLKNHISNKYFCLTCCFVCDDDDTYNDHVKQHVKKISKHECHLCQKKFVRRQQYDQHMTAHEKYLCSSCNTTFPNKKLFLKHQHSVHRTQIEKKYACLICQKLFVRPKYVKLHQRVHTGEKPVTCSHCKKNFSDDKSLRKHMKTVKHLQRVNNQEGQIIEIEKPFLCSKCGMMFYQQHSLFRHIEIVHSTIDFMKCPHCDYKSKCKTNFKRHLELHTNMKRFVCELCGSSFRALATLKEHYVFVHSENRKFVCDICKKGFKNKSTLQRHMRIHSESRPYKCYCNRDYKRMSHLKRHMSSAHQVTLKKNQIPMLMKENANLNSLSDENVTALIKSIEALPDDSSCDDFPVSQFFAATTALSDLNINGESCKKQLDTEIGNNSSFAMSLKSMQNHKSTLNAFDLNQHLEIQPTNSMLLNSETSSTSIDDTNLSLSPSNYCNNSSPLSTNLMENVTTLPHSILSGDVDSLASIDNIIQPSNLNFQTPTSNIDSFVSFSLQNSDSPHSNPAPFPLNGDISSLSHVADLHLESNSSQRQIFGVADDFLSLPSYVSSNEFEANCSSEQFFNWDTDENSNVLKLSNNDLATPSTCASIFSSNLTCNANNLLPNNLFANDSLDATTLNAEFDSLSDLC